MAGEPITMRAARFTGRRTLAAAALGAVAVLLAARWQRGGPSISQTVTGHVEAPVTQVIGSNNTVTAGPRLRDEARDLAADLRTFLDHWEHVPIPEQPNAEDIRDAAAMDRYGTQYESRVRALWDRVTAKGVSDTEMARLMDGAYTRADVRMIAERLDAIARQLPSG